MNLLRPTLSLLFVGALAGSGWSSPEKVKHPFAGWIISAASPLKLKTSDSAKPSQIDPNRAKNFRLHAGDKILFTGETNLLIYGETVRKKASNKWYEVREEAPQVVAKDDTFIRHNAPAGRDRGGAASLESLWRAMSLTTLKNPANPPGLKVQIRIVPVDANDNPRTNVPRVNGRLALKERDLFYIEVSNGSQIPLYVSVMDIDQSSAVVHLPDDPSISQPLIPAGAEWVRLPNRYHASPPPRWDSAVEHYTLIATTHPVDLRVLETKKMQKADETLPAMADPLLYLLRTAGGKSNAEPGVWTTASAEFYIRAASPQGKSRS